jgi:arsenate reductase (thioredoxin)
MGCGDECPLVAGLKRDHWPLENPKANHAQVRAIRNEIRERVKTSVDHEG